MVNANGQTQWPMPGQCQCRTRDLCSTPTPAQGECQVLIERGRGQLSSRPTPRPPKANPRSRPTKPKANSTSAQGQPALQANQAQGQLHIGGGPTRSPGQSQAKANRRPGSTSAEANSACRPIGPARQGQTRRRARVAQNSLTHPTACLRPAACTTCRCRRRLHNNTTNSIRTSTTHRILNQACMKHSTSLPPSSTALQSAARSNSIYVQHIISVMNALVDARRELSRQQADEIHALAISWTGVLDPKKAESVVGWAASLAALPDPQLAVGGHPLSWTLDEGRLARALQAVLACDDFGPRPAPALSSDTSARSSSPQQAPTAQQLLARAQRMDLFQPLHPLAEHLKRAATAEAVALRTEARPVPRLGLLRTLADFTSGWLDPFSVQVRLSQVPSKNTIDSAEALMRRLHDQPSPRLGAQQGQHAGRSQKDVEKRAEQEGQQKAHPDGSKRQSPRRSLLPPLSAQESPPNADPDGAKRTSPRRSVVSALSAQAIAVPSGAGPSTTHTLSAAGKGKGKAKAKSTASAPSKALPLRPRARPSLGRRARARRRQAQRRKPLHRPVPLRWSPSPRTPPTSLLPRPANRQQQQKPKQKQTTAAGSSTNPPPTNRSRSRAPHLWQDYEHEALRKALLHRASTRRTA